eukprot:scaffold8728_cov164-Amphora_coffeaeformis.AAC.12
MSRSHQTLSHYLFNARKRKKCMVVYESLKWMHLSSKVGGRMGFTEKRRGTAEMGKRSIMTDATKIHLEPPRETKSSSSVRCFGNKKLSMRNQSEHFEFAMSACVSSPQERGWCLPVRGHCIASPADCELFVKKETQCFVAVFVVVKGLDIGDTEPNWRELTKTALPGPSSTLRPAVVGLTKATIRQFVHRPLRGVILQLTPGLPPATIIFIF